MKEVELQQRWPLLSEQLSDEERLICQSWSGQTWLQKQGDGSYVCIACKKARARTAFATSGSITTWRTSVFHRHARNAVHQQSVRVFLGLSDAPVGAPSVEEFSRAWRALRQGHAPEDFQEGGEGGRRQKGYDMLRCIHYSLKEADRRFFAQSQALVVSLRRDEKGRRIQVDFTACNRALQTASGVLGVCFNDGGAEGVNRATENIIREYFDKDTSAFKRFCEAVVLLNVDSASDEIAACHQSMDDDLWLASHCGGRPPARPGAREAEHRGFAQLKSLFPNCRFVARDKAHAMHRLLKRSFAADSHMKQLFDRFIFSKTSIIQRVDNSAQFRSWRLGP